MSATVFPLLIAYTLSFFISTGVGIYIWGKRKVPGAFAISVFAFSQASWTFGLIVETVSPTLEAKIFWDNFQFFGWMMALSASLPFLIDYTRRKHAASRNLWVAALAFPILITLLAYTDPWHKLIRPEYSLVNSGGLEVLDYPFTITMYALAALSYIVMLVIITILTIQIFKRKHQERIQAFVITVGYLIPFLGGILSIAGLMPSYLRDTSPFTFGLGNLVIAIGLARFRIFDLMPIARDRILEEMDSAVILATMDDRLSYANPRAISILALAPNFEGQPIPEQLLAWKNEISEPGQGVVTLQDENLTRYFEAKFSQMRHRRQEAVGYIILLNEITDRKLAEDELSKRTRELESQSEELTRQSVELTQRTEALDNLNEVNQDRIAQLEAISDIARSIASIQNIEELLPHITRIISEKFGYYHTGIFLVDDNSEFALLSAANSEGGQRMLARNHRLKVGEVGIVGYVTGKGEPRVALDTGTDAVHFKNPDLPETRSEMAIPLIASGRVIGALDVQSTEPDAFDEEDVSVMQTLADQVSIAIQNARAFEETRRALAEADALYRQNLRKDWNRLARERRLVGFKYAGAGSVQLAEPVQRPEIKRVFGTGKEVIQAKDQDVPASVLAVPLKLRDEIIGVLNIRAPENKGWTQDDVDIVRAVADRVSISAENARLFEETSGRAERERTVAEITNKIRSTNDPNVMLTTAMEELKKALGASRVQIVPYQAAQPAEIKASESAPTSKKSKKTRASS